MNRFQQLTNAVGPFVQTMTPGLRVVAMLLVVAIVVSLTLLFQTATVTTTELLFDGQSFTQSELNQIDVAFAKAKLSGHTIVGRVVRIPSKTRTDYITAISDAEILGPAQTHATAAINKTNIFELPALNRARIQMAKQQDLAEVIRKLDSVEDARVSVNIEETRRLPREMKVSASVNVECESGTPLDPQTAQTIREIVAGDYEDISPIDVGVIDLTSERRFPAGEAIESFTLAADREFARNEVRERRLQEIVEKSLQAYPGARVVVNTQLTAAERSAPNQLCVFVQIPSSYYYRAWRSRTETMSGRRSGTPVAQELTLLRSSTESKIKQNTQQLCGDGIVVAVSSFDDSLQTQPNHLQATTDWLATNWPLLLAVGAVCFFVWNIRTGLTRPNAHQTNEASFESAPDNESTVANVPGEATGDGESPHFPETIDIQTGQLRERLSNVVRNDPDAAARILQDWMKEAS